jgi:hypothetical protein
MTKDEALKMAGYWCVICQRFIEADEYGVIVHDDIIHDYIDYMQDGKLQ